MAISFPISLPTTGTEHIGIRQLAVVSVGKSPFTFEEQVQRHQGQVWQIDIKYPPMKRDTAEALVAALCSLNGREGTFLFGDSANKVPRGVATGTPLVAGASQTGEEILTDGWTAGVTNILRAGDWIQLGTGSAARLHKVLTDINTDGFGQTYITLWPRIWTAWADNTPITTSYPKGVFRLTDNGTAWDVDKAHVYGLTVSAVSLP